MAMFKKYDYRLIKSYKTYTLQELCRLFKEEQLHAQTIRAWIKSGELDSIKDGHKHLVYGGVLKKFLFERNKRHKNRLKFYEFKCCACKQINAPLENTILSAEIRNNGSILATAICPQCGCEMKRLYKGSEESQILAKFQIEKEALLVLSDISCNASKTHLGTDQETTRSESRSNHQVTDQSLSNPSTKVKE